MTFLKRAAALFAAMLALTFELYAEVLPWRALPIALTTLPKKLGWRSPKKLTKRSFSARCIST